MYLSNKKQSICEKSSTSSSALSNNYVNYDGVGQLKLLCQYTRCDINVEILFINLSKVQENKSGFR